MFNIIDTLTKEVVANRKTLNAARKWCASLNQGLNGRYTVLTLGVSTLAVVA